MSGGLFPGEVGVGLIFFSLSVSFLFILVYFFRRVEFMFFSSLPGILILFVLDTNFKLHNWREVM